MSDALARYAEFADARTLVTLNTVPLRPRRQACPARDLLTAAPGQQQP
ncbi:MAG: hypothetical protein R2712_11420 [Vicinamibacterales bacterium]